MSYKDDVMDLVLSMLEASNKLESTLFGSLNFSKADITKFIKKYNVLEKPECNELGFYLLLNNGYITKEQFAKYLGLKYENDNFWLVVDSFDDVLSDSKYEFEIKILDNEFEDYGNDFYNIEDIDYYFRYYDEKTLYSIIQYCIDKGLEVDEELITDENISLRNGEIFVNNIKLKDVIDSDDGLEDLRSELNIAICEAQESADFDEMYNKIINAFKDEVSDFERRTVNIKDKNVEQIYIKITDKKLKEAEKLLIEEYGEYDYKEEKYGNMLYILKEMEFFDFRTPDYNNIYGDIDKGVLNDYTQSRLNF